MLRPPAQSEGCGRRSRGEQHGRSERAPEPRPTAHAFATPSARAQAADLPDHRPTLRWRSCAWLAALRDEHVFEVLARAAPRTSVHVASVALFDCEPCPVEDLWVEVATVVDDDDDPTMRAHRRPTSLEHRGDSLHVARECSLRRPALGGADLARAAII